MGLGIIRSALTAPAGRKVLAHLRIWLALAVALVVGAASPARSADDSVSRFAVREAAPSRPPSRVILLTVSPEDVRSGACRTALYDLLREGGAASTVLWSHAATLCTAVVENTGPVASMTLANLIVSPDGSIDGLRGIRDASLSSAGIHDARWVASAPAAAVPGLRLADLIDRRVPAAVLSHRTAIVSIEDDSEGGPVASVLDGVLESRTPGNAPGWAAGLSAFALSAVLLVARGRPGRQKAAILGGAGIALLGIELLGAWTASAVLLPLPSIAAAALLAVGIERLPRVLHGRRLLRSAMADAQKAVGIRVTEEEFFSGLSRAAMRLHPADFVIVGELVPESFELVLRSADAAAAATVAEPNRDVRRAPYCDEKGNPHTGKISGFLVMRDMPVVAIALTARGGLEGFAFLCGQNAAEAFAKDPRRAQRVARDLGALLRQRRMDRDAGISFVAQSPDDADPNVAAARLLSDARARFDLAALAARYATDATLYADPLGDVRGVNRKMAAELSAAGVAVARATDAGELPRGTLLVDDVLARFCGPDGTEAREVLVGAHQRAEGVTVPVAIGPDRKAMLLTLRVLRRKAHGVIVPVGYVLSLREPRAAVGSSIPPSITKLAPVDALQVVRLWEALSTVVEQAARHSSTQIRLAARRGGALVIAQRATVFPALTAFLVEAAKLQHEDRPPLVTIRERSTTVEVAIRDLRLGIPRSTLERIVETPAAAPPELESLAALLHAVEDSQGKAQVKGDETWGADLVLRFLRARVAVGRLSEAPPRLASVRPLAKKRTASDPPSRK